MFFCLIFPFFKDSEAADSSPEMGFSEANELEKKIQENLGNKILNFSGHQSGILLFSLKKLFYSCFWPWWENKEQGFFSLKNITGLPNHIIKSVDLTDSIVRWNEDTKLGNLASLIEFYNFYRTIKSLKEKDNDLTSPQQVIKNIGSILNIAGNSVSLAEYFIPEYHSLKKWLTYSKKGLLLSSVLFYPTINIFSKKKSDVSVPLTSSAVQSD